MECRALPRGGASRSRMGAGVLDGPDLARGVPGLATTTSGRSAFTAPASQRETETDCQAPEGTGEGDCSIPSRPAVVSHEGFDLVERPRLVAAPRLPARAVLA